MNQARGQGGGSGASGSAVIGAAGYYTPATVSTNTELYDGTSWANDAACSTGRFDTTVAGTTQAALLIAGFLPPYTAATEEFTGAGAAVTKTITVS